MDSSQRVRAILSFVQAADAGSFAAGARALGISSAAVSKNIAGLERALGVRLMNRTTRTLNLTEEGEAFLRQARIALEALDQAADAVVSSRAAPTGRVRLSTSVGFGREQLAPVLPGLLARYPGLAVEVDFDDRVIDLVHDGYDLALRGGRIADSSLVSRTICHFNMVLVASPDYLAAHGVPRRPEDLAQHRLLTRRFLGGRVSPWNFKARDGSITTLNTDASVLTLSSPETLTQAAVAGLGVAEVGAHHAWKHLQSGALRVLLLKAHHPGHFEMTLQYPHRALVAPRVRVTVAYLLEAFAQMEELHLPLSALRAYEA
ncbi:LysR substrate-binding domain-containing protein [Curvibacter sp. HBC61]|uniref:LysR substrate-binding domain-containing protein n=1 Tax=Curvibacter cyanobacteriorum TaxID=3026422 RepID=A0ABT5N0M1_9BURK|nr:LysR family transcriptional regulator [Curvibacter sp. HBC61]MDD0839865.1 LysR substrate-binding domain-containing protein [Curvibacter sp. HBC61]